MEALRKEEVSREGTINRGAAERAAFLSRSQ